MRISPAIIAVGCFALGVVASGVWAQQAARAQVHRADKLDASFSGHGTRSVDPKLKARLQLENRSHGFRRLSDKLKIGLISQAGKPIAGIISHAVLTPQQPVIPNKACFQALNVVNWWTPTPGHEDTPGYMQMSGLSDLLVQILLPTTRSILVTFNIKAKKGNSILMTLMPLGGAWKHSRLVVCEEGEQTLTCEYSPSEPGVYMVQLCPQDEFTWYFYSTEISIAK